MSTASRTNTIRVVIGQTKVIRVEVSDANGRPMKLHGATVVFTVRTDHRSEASVILSGSGIEIVDPAKGVLMITIDSDKTSNIPKGRNLYDIWVIFDGSPPVRHPVVRMAELWAEESVTQF